jgi:hypothetical protein
MTTAPRKLLTITGGCATGIAVWAVALIVTLIAFNWFAPGILRARGLREFGEDEIRGFSLKDLDSVLLCFNVLIVCLFFCAIVAAVLSIIAWTTREK